MRVRVRNLEELVVPASRGDSGFERNRETGPLGSRLTMALQMRAVLCLSNSTTISYMRTYARHSCDKYTCVYVLESENTSFIHAANLAHPGSGASSDSHSSIC